MKRDRLVELDERVFVETLLDNRFRIELTYLKSGDEDNVTLSATYFGDQTYPKDDLCYLGVQMVPPLDRLSERSAYLQLEDCITAEKLRIKLVTEDSCTRVDLEGKYQYLVGVHHAIRLHEGAANIIEFTIQNIQLAKNVRRPVLNIVVSTDDWTRSLLDKPQRLVSPSYYPADIKVMASLEHVVIQDVPQRTPYWFKARDLVTGTKAYKYCGFFSNNKPFSEDDLKRMRFGRLTEDAVCTLFLKSQPPNVTVQLVGLVPYKERAGWGASPDGIIHDPHMAWDDVPSYCRDAYRSDPSVTITKGVLEIKCSQTNCEMQDYYFPQVYLEMMSTGTVWTDVVRYCDKMVNKGNGCWFVERELRIYRLYRDRETENAIVSCILSSLQVHEQMQRQLFRTAKYVALRKSLRRLARATDYKPVHVDDAIVDGYHAYIAAQQHCDIQEQKKLKV